MAERKPQWSEPGDLEIVTIEKVTDYSVYAKLDEFEKRGLLHVYEFSFLQKTAGNMITNNVEAGGQGALRREK